MSWTDILTIVAILLSPVIAVQVERWLQRQREIRDRKLRVFHVLMANRAARLTPVYVEALNMIDLAFSGKKERKVRDKWRECLDKFATYPKVPEVPKQTATAPEKEEYERRKAQYEAELNRHNDSVDELTADLLMAMAEVLDYTFDRVHIKRGAYIPQALSNSELEWNAVRRGLVEVLYFGRSLPLDVKSVATDPKAEEQFTELRKQLIERLSNDRPIAVRVTKD